MVIGLTSCQIVIVRDAMIRCGLFDGMFPHQEASTLMGECGNEKPQYIEWVRNEYLPITFYTDISLHHVNDAPDGICNVAMLLEAPPFRTRHYQEAIGRMSQFNHILTYLKSLIEIFGEPFKWYPHCGSRIPISKFGMHKKSKIVSFVSSDKNLATGHIVRHEVYKRYGNRLDVFGSISGDLVPKLDTISEYMYTVVVAAERHRGLFSDHIIDPLSVGTVPIFWKAWDIGDYFDTDGIITFETVDELGAILDSLSENDYHKRGGYVLENVDRAARYRCAEDWVVESYPFIFEGAK